ncbi:MAG: ABC-2 family transporter protein [Peptostreptococcaceae bacterium]|nr:ABC-2 family transporter protein [Peptostreptococcaceae bacterium]
MKYIKLYLSFIKNSFRRDTMYRFNLFVNMFTVVLGYLSNILFYYFLYDAGIENISGWTRYQIYILLASVWIIDSVFGGLFFFNLIRVPSKVKNYELDGILTKPVNSIFMIALRQCNFGLFAGVFFGIGFLVYSLIQGNIQIQFVNLLYYVILILCSVMILFSILLIMVTFSLRFVRIQGLIQMFWAMMDIGKNPHSIYPSSLRMCFLFIIPAITIYNFPAQVLMDTCYIPGMNIGSASLTAIVITLVLTATAILYFKKSLKFYYQ